MLNAILNNIHIKTYIYNTYNTLYKYIHVNKVHLGITWSRKDVVSKVTVNVYNNFPFKIPELDKTCKYYL